LNRKMIVLEKQYMRRYFLLFQVKSRKGKEDEE
jgi:hypothetical protein